MAKQQASMEELLKKNKDFYIDRWSNSIFFLEEKIYNKIRTEIYNNRDRLFVVAGKWERIKQYDYFISNIYSDRQVKVIR